jgi:hypothetical protein
MRKIKLFSIAVILFITGSCGNKSETAGDKKEEVKKENPGQQGDQQSTGKDESQKTGDAGQSESDLNKLNELGMTPGLPSNFPSDVPQPKNSKTLGSLNSSEGTVVTFESNDKVIDIINFYKEEMKKNGYEIAEGGESIISDKGGLINWKKGAKDVGIMLGYDKDKNITSLVITYK